MRAAIVRAFSCTLIGGAQDGRAADGQAAAAPGAVAHRACWTVSPCRTTIWSKATPRWSATIWAKVVSWPWPWADVPVKAVTVPVGSTRTMALSKGPKPHIST